MAQKDNKFTAFWMDTTTAPWTPLTGLSATILIKLATSPYTVVVNNQAMTDIGNGDYIYIFDWYSSEQDYIYHCSPWATAFIMSGQTDSRQDYLDKSITEIAVWWNPYITGIGWLQKGIQKIINKVEDKWEEIINEFEEIEEKIIKSFPEYKEPIVNITTEKIDTEWFMNAIKNIPAPIVNITTESIDTSPIITEIRSIGRIVDIKFPEYPEQKLTDISGIEKCIDGMMEKIDNIPNNTKKIEKIEAYINKKNEEEENEYKIKEEEEIMKRPIPNSFTDILN